MYKHEHNIKIYYILNTWKVLASIIMIKLTYVINAMAYNYSK